MVYITKADYKNMYCTLLRGADEALAEMERKNYIAAEYILKKAMYVCEDIFIDTCEEYQTDDGKDELM